MEKYTHPVVGRETPYEDACKHLNMTPLTLEEMKIYPENQRPYMLSNHRIVTVLDVVKEGDAPLDYDNYERKHFPWWDMETYNDEPAGSGFSLYGVGCAYTHSGVGSRLSTLEEEKTQYVAEIMLEDYRVVMKG